jgi:hypothetical protein
MASRNQYMGHTLARQFISNAQNPECLKQSTPRIRARRKPQHEKTPQDYRRGSRIKRTQQRNDAGPLFFYLEESVAGACSISSLPIHAAAAPSTGIPLRPHSSLLLHEDTRESGPPARERSRNASSDGMLRR